MDLRAWKETESKATQFNANILSIDESEMPKTSLNYQHTDEYEAEDGSPPKGSGTGPMPVLEPEDDWVEELPRPIQLNKARTLIQADEDVNY